MQREMYALSLSRPWAWAMFHGKNIENRNWRINYRGRIVIHASQTWDPDGFLFLASHPDLLDANLPSPGGFPTGLIGELDIIDMVTASYSVWFFGPYGHITANAKEYNEPLTWPGKLGLFKVPTEILPTFALPEQNFRLLKQ